MNRDEQGRPSHYLGDGVYATMDYDKDMIRLTTGSHRESEAENTIWLESLVLDGLVKFAKACNFS